MRLLLNRDVFLKVAAERGLANAAQIAADLQVRHSTLSRPLREVNPSQVGAGLIAAFLHHWPDVDLRTFLVATDRSEPVPDVDAGEDQ